MSSQQQTTGQQSNSLQFNPQAQSIYNMLTKSGSGVLNDMMTNPFGNEGYKLGLGQSMQGATQMGNQNMQSMMQNMRTSGIGGSAGNAFQAAQTGQIGRANQGMRSQAQISNIMQAFQRQMGATGMGMSFSPQITGSSGTSSQTQTTGGLGTWLPQLIGAGLGAAGGAMTGGMSSLMKSPASSAGGGSSIMPTGFSGTFGGANPVSGLQNPFGNMMMAAN